MNIGLLNERVTFQTVSIEVDKYGNHKSGWIDLFTCSATIGTGTSGTKNGDENTDAGTTTEQPTMTVTVRYSPQAAAVRSTTHRMVFQDEVYNILGVDMMNFRKKSIKFSCRRERP